MSAIEIVTAILLADATITGKVGTAVTPLVARQGQALPYITLDLVSEDEDQHLVGATGSFEARVAVHFHGATYGEADALAEDGKAALGNVTNRAVAGATVSVWKDGADVSDFADDRSLYRRIIDFTARWTK